MKIIVLAAGKGERLRPLTTNTPKSLLDVGNGKMLIEEQVERMQKSNVIDEMILVIGYLAEQIEAQVKKLVKKGARIRTIYNPFYDISSNLISLWFAIREISSDFIITNGDNIFSSDVFTSLVKENGNGIFLSINKKERYDNDDMKVTIENDSVARVSKSIGIDKTNAESPGLVLVRGSQAISAARDSLETLVKMPQHKNSFWLEMFNHLAENGVRVCPWEFDGNNKWQELDFHLDVKKLREFLRLKV